MKQLMIIFPIIQIFSTKHYKCSSVPFHSLESITPANSQIEEESSSDGTFAQKKKEKNNVVIRQLFQNSVSHI